MIWVRNVGFLVAVGLLVLLATQLFAVEKGELEIRVVDRDTGKPLVARMHLKDARGKPVKPPKVPFWKDHFVIPGTMVLALPLGHYTFELERGPEYKVRSGYFTIERHASDNKEVDMQRFIDMSQAGWWSGDLHTHRPPADMELLMLADDLHIGPVITWWNNENAWKDKPLPAEPLVQFDSNRFYRVLAGEDERAGGSLLYFNLNAPLPIAGAKREYPSPLKFLLQARETPGVHVDIAKPFSWDLPVWVASGKVNSIGLANNHLWREGMLTNEAGGKPRDTSLYPNPDGNGRWSQAIYYHLLNCGIRLPPSAGSDSGVMPNPVGYNRVYVHCGDKLTWDSWWENLRRGRVVVTNGPLLQPLVNGELPGHVFQDDPGQTVELNVTLNLSTRDKIEYLEVVKNGKVEHEVRLDQWAAAGGKLPPVKFDQSGWMLVRAVTSDPKTFRFATTGPYYVEIGYQPRISRTSAQFFCDWVLERAKRVECDTPAERSEVIEFHRAARDFWHKKLEQANAE